MFSFSHRMIGKYPDELFGQPNILISQKVLICNRPTQMMAVKYWAQNKCKFPFSFFELFAYFLSAFEDRDL